MGPKKVAKKLAPVVRDLPPQAEVGFEQVLTIVREGRTQAWAAAGASTGGGPSYVGV
jgi:hypothetical protein